jgi:DHA1 family tetracycline resistance protein-like MFS transporter
MSELSPAGSSDRASPKGALKIIFFIVFMDLLGFGIIIPLMPRYVPDYQHHVFGVTLLFSVYSICQFIGAPVLGLLSDRHGRRPVLVLSQLGSVIGYALLGVATDWGGHYALLLIYISRVIDGFTGGNISTAQAYVSDVTTNEDRAKGMGMIGAAFGIGFSVGPAIGGILGKYHVSWPAYLAALMSLGAAIQTWRRLPETRHDKPVEAEVWLHPSRFLPILRNPVLVQFLAIGFCTMAGFVMMETTMVLYLDRTFGYKEAATGWYFAFIGLIIVIVQGRLIGPLTRRFGEWPLAILGPLFIAMGMAGLTRTAFAPMLALLLVSGACNAIGRSLQTPTLTALVSRYADSREQGVTFGLFHGLGSLSRVAGPVLAGWGYQHFFVRNTGQFVLAAGIAIGVALWTLALSRTVGKAAALARTDETPVVV